MTTFSHTLTISGNYVVIADDTGHQVIQREYENAAGASGAASSLNLACKRGPKALAAALGAAEKATDYRMEFVGSRPSPGARSQAAE